MIVWQHTCSISRNPNNAISSERSIHLSLSVRRRNIIDPGRFLTGGPPAGRRRDSGVVPPVERKGDRAVVPMQDHLP